MGENIPKGNSPGARRFRYEMFVKAYIANHCNAIKAAEASGYSTKAGTINRLLKDPMLVAMLAEETTRLTAKAGLTADRVLKELEHLCFSDGRKLLNADGTVKQPSEWDDATAAAVSGMKVTEEFEGQGKSRERVGQTKDVKFWDKGSALNMAAKHLGLFERDNAQRAPNLALQIVAIGPD